VPVRRLHRHGWLLTAPRENKELAALADLGHFLKGSSATLGLVYVRDSCEKIQHFGSHKDETGTLEEPDVDVCLKRLATTIKQAKTEFEDVEKVLRRYLREP
jgi:osomolarity two-component system, phosphorelay intermediate protein YPD1